MAPSTRQGDLLDQLESTLLLIAFECLSEKLLNEIKHWFSDIHVNAIHQSLSKVPHMTVQWEQQGKKNGEMPWQVLQSQVRRCCCISSCSFPSAKLLEILACKFLERAGRSGEISFSSEIFAFLCPVPYAFVDWLSRVLGTEFLDLMNAWTTTSSSSHLCAL